MNRPSDYTHLELIDVATGEQELIELTHPCADESVRYAADFNNMKPANAWQALYEGQTISTFGFNRRLVKGKQ